MKKNNLTKPLMILLAALPFIATLAVYIAFVPNNLFSPLLGIVRLNYDISQFSFMGHSITEGAQIDTIMQEKGMEYFYGAVSKDPFYAKTNNGYSYIMCPANSKKDLDNSDWSGSEWISGYSVGAKDLVDITIYRSSRHVEEYYSGPINIGDSYDDVMSMLKVGELKKKGTYSRHNQHVYYSCITNHGPVTFEERPSGDRDEFDRYKSVSDYLAEDHTVSYVIYEHPYRLSVAFQMDSSGNPTVSAIAVSYDPERLYEKMN